MFCTAGAGTTIHEPSAEYRTNAEAIFSIFCGRFVYDGPGPGGAENCRTIIPMPTSLCGKGSSILLTATPVLPNFVRFQHNPSRYSASAVISTTWCPHANFTDLLGFSPTTNGSGYLNRQLPDGGLTDWGLVVLLEIWHLGGLAWPWGL